MSGLFHPLQPLSHSTFHLPIWVKGTIRTISRKADFCNLIKSKSSFVSASAHHFHFWPHVRSFWVTLGRMTLGSVSFGEEGHCAEQKESSLRQHAGAETRADEKRSEAVWSCWEQLESHRACKAGDHHPLHNQDIQQNTNRFEILDQLSWNVDCVCHSTIQCFKKNPILYFLSMCYKNTSSLRSPVAAPNKRVATNQSTHHSPLPLAHILDDYFSKRIQRLRQNSQFFNQSWISGYFAALR